MPSQYIHVPSKQPDKLGFDEVSQECCEDGICKNGSVSTSVLNISLCCQKYIVTLTGSNVAPHAGVHDKPAEASRPQGTYAEGTARAGDRL